MASVSKRKSEEKNKKAKYLINWLDAETDRWRTCVGHTDRALSLAKGQRLELESARRREGFSSSVREESLKPIDEPLGEYLTHLRVGNPDPNYLEKLERRIRRVLTDINARRLIDITAAKVETALMNMKSTRGFEEGGKLLAVSTRNEYATSITGFTKWAEDHHKIEYDPLAGLAKADLKDDDRVHPRRALPVEDITALLNAAVQRPETDLLTIRVGKNKGQIGAKVRASVLEKARRLGKNRRMAYLVAVWTGLRRTELERLEWRDVLLDLELPFIQLRAGVTKSNRADTLALHPQLADELRAFKPADARPTDRVLPTVPDMDVMKLDLKFAGIEYGDDEIGFADLHAQRKTMNTMLASQGMESRIRQAQLRHTDPRLTEGTYFDKLLFVKPQAEAMNRVAAIPGIESPVNPVSAERKEENRAGLAQEIGVPNRQNGALPDTMAAIELKGISCAVIAENLVFYPDFGPKRHDPASCDTGSLLKRAKGVEPSTFTLAT